MRLPNKQKYYEKCFSKLLNLVFIFLKENKIKYSEINKKSYGWFGKCYHTPYLSEIVYNQAHEKEINKHILKPFVILHELGHYYDNDLKENIKNGLIKENKLEETADDFIYSFCVKNLNLFEFFILHKFIESFSKHKITFTNEEKIKIKKIASAYGG